MNVSGNIQAVFFKFGTRNVHHKRNKMASVMPLPRQHAWLQSLSKTKYPHMQPFSEHIWCLYCLNSSQYILESEWSFFKRKLGISVLTSTWPAAKLLAWLRHNWYLLCCTCSVLSLKNTALVFLKIFLIQYFAVLADRTIDDCPYLQNRRPSISKNKIRYSISKTKTPFLFKTFQKSTNNFILLQRHLKL